MPHFNIDCSESIFSQQNPQTIAEAVHQAALSTELFAEANIQVKVKTCSSYLMGGKKEDVVSVFASILEGRTHEQKLNLSKAIVNTLCDLFPDVQHIHANVTDLQKGTGFDKNKR